jgi:NAD(P)-dependent dehydrogenase (short-subunit alcohol dehydrogenase family)
MVAGRRSGSLVALSSVAGRSGRANAPDYAASKAGVISVVKSAALALAPHGIRANAVCPGVVETPMTTAIHEQNARELGITPDESLRRMVAGIPLGRVETPDEVADAIAFLLGDGGRYVTGQALNVCGGIEMD